MFAGSKYVIYLQTWAYKMIISFAFSLKTPILYYYHIIIETLVSPQRVGHTYNLISNLDANFDFTLIL